MQLKDKSRNGKVVTIRAAVVGAGPGHLKHHGGGDLTIVAVENPLSAELNEKTLTRIQHWLVEAGVPVTVSDNINGALWGKLAVNCAYNAISAVSQSVYRKMIESTGIAESVVEANWKIFLEGFIEGYHIRSTHPETFLPYGFDNLNVIDIFGRNSRVTYPFRRIRKLAELPETERKVTGFLTYVYLGQFESAIAHFHRTLAASLGN